MKQKHDLLQKSSKIQNFVKDIYSSRKTWKMKESSKKTLKMKEDLIRFYKVYNNRIDVLSTVLNISAWTNLFLAWQRKYFGPSYSRLMGRIQY